MKSADSSRKGAPSMTALFEQLICAAESHQQNVNKVERLEADLEKAREAVFSSQTLLNTAKQALAHQLSVLFEAHVIEIVELRLVNTLTSPFQQWDVTYKVEGDFGKGIKHHVTLDSETVRQLAEIEKKLGYLRTKVVRNTEKNHG